MSTWDHLFYSFGTFDATILVVIFFFAAFGQLFVPAAHQKGSQNLAASIINLNTGATSTSQSEALWIIPITGQLCKQQKLGFPLREGFFLL